ncbi:MAG: hypothetical protein ACLQVY_06815 [Limisphaerales bacterium]
MSGSLWRGNPSRLVDAILDGSATLCASGLVMAEFEEVIQREKFQKRLEHEDLLSMEFFEGIPILTIGQALERLGISAA